MKFKHLKYLPLILFCLKGFGQKAIKDTVIENTTYHFAHYRIFGKLKALSQNKNEKDGGVWIYFDRRGKKQRYGNYDNDGEKDGAWWGWHDKKWMFTIYNHGKIMPVCF